MSYASEVLADTPGGYWKLDESSGFPQDSSGNGNHITAFLNNAPTLGQSKLAPNLGTCALFAPASQQAYNRASAATLLLGDIWTVEFWGKFNTFRSPDMTPVCKEVTAYQVSINPTGSISHISSGTAELRNTNAILATGVAYHIVCTKTGSTYTTYVNAVSQTLNVVSNGSTGDNAGTFTIGATGTVAEDEYMDGYMSNVAVYAGVLSPTRIQAHFAAAFETPIAPRQSVPPVKFGPF